METTLSAEQVIQKHHPFYNPDLVTMDVLLNGEQVADLMKEYARIQIQSPLTDKQLRKMAKKACEGNQHAMRYNSMLECCFKMGQMVLQEIDKQSITSTPINLK